MTADTPSQSEPLPGTVFNARQARILKIAVIVMGLMLVAGFVALLGAIVYQASRSGESASAPAAAPPAGETRALAVPAGAEISRIAMDGDRLAVHLSGPSGSEIVVLDMRTGAVLSRVRLRPE